MKALELAGQAEKTAGDRLDSFLEDWAIEAEVDLLACAAELRRLAAVAAECDALKAELEGRYQSIIDMGNMLTEIVNLIMGEPEEGTSHSTHDAVELVRGLAMHNDLYAAAVELEVAKLKAENERLLAANRDCIAHYEDARAELERIKALEPVATVMAHPTPSVSYSIRAIHGIPHGTKLYALGSKTA